MENVLECLKALGSGVGKQDICVVESFYNIAQQRILQTDVERESFKLGSLAIMADAAGYKMRTAYYRYKFKQALKEL